MHLLDIYSYLSKSQVHPMVSKPTKIIIYNIDF